MRVHGKHYRAAVATLEPRKLYSPREAVEKVKATAYAKFDESVDIAVRLGVDPKHADQIVRGTVSLPHGTGKNVRVLVIAQGEKAKEAEAAGADRQEVVRRRGAGGEPAGLQGGHCAGQARRGEGTLHPVDHGLEHDGTGSPRGSGGVRMIRTKAEKQEMVTALATRLRNASTVYVTDFTGLDVAKITQLRRRLRLAGGGTDFVVVKNTLARRALADAQVQGLEAHLAGPTGLVLTGADPIAAAKVLADFAKEFEKPAIKVGLVDGKTVTPELVKRLASLPTKHELLAQLGGALQAPMAGFVGALNGLLMNMMGALEALRTKRAADGGGAS